MLEQAIAQEEDGPDLTLRLAALLHDIGKPATRRFEPGGGVSFHHHEVVGAEAGPGNRLRALKLPKAVIDDVAALTFLHLRFHGYGTGAWTDSAVRRYVTDAGPLLTRLHKLVRADCTTRNRRRRQHCNGPTTISRRGSPGSPPPRISPGSGPTSTATRSWTCSECRRVRSSAGPGRSSRICGWSTGPLGRTEAEQALRDWAEREL